MSTHQINISTDATAIAEVHKIFKTILSSDVDQATMVKALEVLPKVATIDSVVITGCSFDSRKTTEVNLPNED